MSWASFVLPTWTRYLAYALLMVATWGHGYVTGVKREDNKLIVHDTKVIVKQGEITTKIITKYISIKEKQTKLDEGVKQDGKSYAILFPNDNYHFNNEYVRVFNESVTGVPTLPSGNLGDSTSTTVSEQLSVSVNNNTVARYWKNRAEECEAWTKEQEKESVK